MCNHNPTFCNILLLLGRICFSLIFIIAGVQKIINFDGAVATLVAKGVPFAEYTMMLAIFFELVGGLLIFLGLFTRLGALMIFIFVIPVTAVFHVFWTYTGVEAATNFVQFFKNLSIVGATLYIMVAGGGRFSLDSLIRRKRGGEQKLEKID